MKQLKLAGILILLCSLAWLSSCDPVENGTPCGSFECFNGGECIEDVNGILRCECPDGFTGEDCGTETDDECANVECPPNSTCVDGTNAECQCDEGFVADPATNSCVPVDDCDNIECPPNSTCIEDIDGELVCECDEGFEPDPNGTNTCVAISANTREKFLGQYDGVDECREEPGQITYNITITPSNTDPAKIFIAGLGGFTAPGGADINLEAEIVGDTQFRIPEQTVTFEDGTTGVFESTTIGSYSFFPASGDEVLGISYEVLFSDPNTLDDECDAIWTKR